MFKIKIVENINDDKFLVGTIYHTIISTSKLFSKNTLNLFEEKINVDK